jgi:stringent starvation protein B
MNSTRPYLIRAFYEWIVDSDCTPHIVVNAEVRDVLVPRDFVEGGQIVLNIAMPAVQDLSLNNDSVSFKARFSGVPHDVFIPVNAVMAIYARENGRGMVFSEDDEVPPPDSAQAGGKDTSEKGGKGDKGGKGKAHLTVVK